MKESYEEELANHFGLQRRGDCGNNVVLSVRAEGQAGQLLSSEITTFACRPLQTNTVMRHGISGKLADSFIQIVRRTLNPSG